MIRVPSSKRFSAGYRLGPTVIDVEADDPNTASWLAEFLTPWFEVGASGKGEFTVRLTYSMSALAALEHQQTTMSPRPVACFALDSQVISLPGWLADDGGTVIADSRYACFYRVSGRTIEVVSRPEVPRVRVGLMRVVRELAAARMLEQTSILDIHSAALVVGGRAVLLVGPKGAGKTTLLVSVLASRQASLLANDRVFVDAGRYPHQAFGMPTLASLHEGTLQLFPILRRGLAGRPSWMRATELGPPDFGAREDDNAQTVYVSPTRLAQQLGAPTVREGPIAAIVFPEIASASDVWSVDPVGSADGASRLRECLYGICSRPRPHTIFEELVDSRTDRSNDQAGLVDRLATQTPLFRCRVGRDVLHNGAKALLQAVFPDQANRMCAR